MKNKRDLINEMALGMGAMASGAGEFGEDDLDMGPPGMGGDLDDLGDDDDLGMDDDDDDDLGMGDDDDEVHVSKSDLRDKLESLERGECSVDECLDELCGGLDDDDDVGDDMDDMGMGLDDDMGMGGMGGMGGGDEDYMEGINRIASMLTDDPDITTAPTPWSKKKSKKKPKR